MNPATTLPGWSVLRAPLMTPASISGTTPSGHISLCTPRSLWLERRASTALGMPPIPDLRERLARAVDDARFNQRHHPIGTHFAVHAQILVAGKTSQHRVGNAADSHLQRGAIGNQRGQIGRAHV